MKDKTDQIINDAIEHIKNVHNNKKIEIKKYLLSLNKHYTSRTATIKIIRKYLGIDASYPDTSEKYWILRGWSSFETYHKVKAACDKRKGRLSPFGYKFWMQRGLSEEQAIFKSKSLCPIKKEYWLQKGLSEEEAKDKAREVKNNNDKKGSNKIRNRDISKHKNESPRCIEYWINKNGLSEYEARLKVAEVQTTFSLEICIEKYGEEEGFNRWKERQEKWLKSLDKKSGSEKERINSLKGRITRKCDIKNNLYVIQMLSPDKTEKFIKIGVTDKDIVSRFSSQIRYGWEIDVIYFIQFEHAYEVEQKMLAILNDLRYIPKNKFEGWTECFPLDKKNLLLEIMKDELNDTM